MPKISTVIITYNEEANIERCLKSVQPFSDEIIVVDSQSTDGTVEIARRFATRVITQEWLGHGRQKQLAVRNASNTWVFSIDADEEVSPALATEIQNLDFTHDGYEVPRSVRYLNRWIRHGVWYPGYVMRLFRRDKGAFSDDIVHETVKVTGNTARLKNDLRHFTYRDIAHHIATMNDFTTLAAKQMREQGRRAGVGHVVVLPFLEFFKSHIIKRGFLDGYAGLVVSVLHAKYVFLKYVKLRELSLQSTRAEPSQEKHAAARDNVEARR